MCPNSAVSGFNWRNQRDDGAGFCRQKLHDGVQINA
jgi:hypothetical protein